MFTKGPWVWTSDEAGPADEYGTGTRGAIDLTAFEPSGTYLGNPELYPAPPWDSDTEPVLSAGGGEYSPLRGDAATRAANGALIAAAPLLYGAVERALPFLPVAVQDELLAVLATARGEKS